MIIWNIENLNQKKKNYHKEFLANSNEFWSDGSPLVSRFILTFNSSMCSVEFPTNF